MHPLTAFGSASEISGDLAIHSALVCDVPLNTGHIQGASFPARDPVDAGGDDIQLKELVAEQKRSALRLAILESRVAAVKYSSHQTLAQTTKEATDTSVALRKDINSARLKVEQLQLGPTLPLEIVAMILWLSLVDEGKVGPRPSQLAKLLEISSWWNHTLPSMAMLWNTVEFTFTSRTSCKFGDGLASLLYRGRDLGLHILFHCRRSEDACGDLKCFWETVAPYTRSLTIAASLWEDWQFEYTHLNLEFPKLQLLHMEQSRGSFLGSSAHNSKYLFGGSFPLLTRCVFVFGGWDWDDDPEELTEGLSFVVSTLKTLTLASSSDLGQAHWLKRLTLPCLEELSVQSADVEQLSPFFDRSQPPLTMFACLGISSLLDPVVLPNLSELNISQRHPIGNWDIIWDVMNRRRETLKSIIIRSHSMGLN
ncbi:hypothetical protein R3P38DRAFT_3230720 [Favolaschia claudopus]|uniref:F-box domain-containing protein n=1 Tax=Favolaschia claudopus TaxID=2862362 RepID=A0AAV9ZLH3_9AGAR